MIPGIMIIGARPGIGLAVARRFAQEAFRVVLIASCPNDLQVMLEALREMGADASGECADISDPSVVDAIVTRYASDIGVIHYNRGLLAHAVSPAANERDGGAEVAIVEPEIAANLAGALATLRAALLEFYQRGFGTILLSGGQITGGHGAESRSSSVGKGAIRAMTSGLFEVSRSHGVHIGMVTATTHRSWDWAELEEQADLFWSLHVQTENDWQWEKTYP